MSFEERRVARISEALPQEVLNLFNATDKISEIFPVNNNERFSGQILKVDEIIFQPTGSLILANTANTPFVVVYAESWKFHDVAHPILIGFDQSVHAANGSDGSKGARGADGVGENSRTGLPGGPGAVGNPGAD